jgi:hypothetical protein
MFTAILFTTQPGAAVISAKSEPRRGTCAQVHPPMADIARRLYIVRQTGLPLARE